jgi:DNA-binding response OmpR family regulator
MPNILIIDAIAEYRDNLAEMLGYEGFEISQVQNALLGFAQMALHRPDLILLDLSFPKYDGFTFIEWVRRNRVFARIPIIVISSFNDKVCIERAISSGADEYMVKPVAMTQIIESLRNYFVMA